MLFPLMKTLEKPENPCGRTNSRRMSLLAGDRAFARAGSYRSIRSSPERGEPDDSCRIDQTLEEKLDAELELARIERGGWTAVVKPTVPLTKCIDIPEEGRGRRFIEPVEEIEAFRYQVNPEALA
jgi:hypothetical protein